MDKLNSIYLGVKDWRFKRRTVDLLALFIVSPFLAIPNILLGIYNRNKSALALFIFLFGLLSFMYIPNAADDKAFYFYNHLLFEQSGFTFSDFWKYISASGRPDFLLLLVGYFFAKIGVSFQFLAMLTTITTLGILYFLFNKITSSISISNKTYFSAFILLLFCISLPTLFSGIRFYLAFSLSLLGFWYGLKYKRHLLAFAIFGVATITHFGSAIFFPTYVAIAMLWKYNYLITACFCVSFIFVLLPKEILYQGLSAVGLPASYQTKADIYFAGEDVLASRGGNQSLLAQVALVIKQSWVAIGFLFVCRNFKQVSQLKSATLIFWSFTNLVYSVPTVYARFMLIPKTFFAFWLIFQLNDNKNKSWLYALLLLWGMAFVADLIVMRLNLLPSYFSLNSITLLSVFFKTVTPENFIR